MVQVCWGVGSPPIYTTNDNFARISAVSECPRLLSVLCKEVQLNEGHIGGGGILSLPDDVSTGGRQKSRAARAPQSGLRSGSRRIWDEIYGVHSIPLRVLSP